MKAERKGRCLLLDECTRRSTSMCSSGGTASVVFGNYLIEGCAEVCEDIVFKIAGTTSQV